MKPLSRINSPSIDIEAFLNGLSWEDPADIQKNLAALASGVELLNSAILNHLIPLKVVDFKLLTRTIQDSDPIFKVCEILEDFLTTHTGDAVQFREVAEELSLFREVLAGFVKCAEDETGKGMCAHAFTTYRELLPKIHVRFFASEDTLLRWKAAVMLEQQVDFVSQLLSEGEGIAEKEALLAWGNDYLETISRGGTEGSVEAAGATEIEPILANLKSNYHQLLQSEVKLEVEEYEKTIVLTPAKNEHALSGLSELIFRARKEAEKGATFQLALELEAVPMADPAGAAGPPVPVHLIKNFKTSCAHIEDITKLVDGFVRSLQDDVDGGAFKEQDALSLKQWFTDSIIPWIEGNDGVVAVD